MIFVTVGTERFPFDRLIRAVDELRGELQGESIFIQTGYSTYTPTCPHRAFLPYTELRDKICQAKIVVGHAGVGTLLMCATLGKVPIMMARKRSYREHVDDHQQMLAERMARRGTILLASRAEDIRECILLYEERLRSLGGIGMVEPRLAHHLKEVLSEISRKRSVAGHVT